MPETNIDIKTTTKPWKNIAFSLCLFSISLTQNAFTYEDFDGIKTFSSITAVLLGSTAILGGGLFEWIIWLANPLYMTSVVLFLDKSKHAKTLINISFCLALSFSFWTNILISENGRDAKILHKGFGYWLWTLSILVLMVGINKYFRSSNNSVQPNKQLTQTDVAEIIIENEAKDA